MKSAGTSLQLFDPRRGDLSFQVERWEDADRASQPRRSNFFTIFLIQSGVGSFESDSARGIFTGPSLLFFHPYQPFSLQPDGPFRATVLHFHANFFCIETHHQAVGCNGVLFNNVYGVPVVSLTQRLYEEFTDLIAQMERELRAGGLAHGEILVALLKVFLVKATRLKLAREQREAACVGEPRPPQLLESLTALIEQHFRKWHAPAEYAAALHTTPKTLGKLVKARFGRTLTHVIRDRILKEAKWQLLHTTRSVKEIAWETGFADEFYFSRLFKRATSFAPTEFREFEAAIRSGAQSVHASAPSVHG